MTLSLRERILVLYATAPEGFGMTLLELKRKFAATREIHGVVGRMRRKGALELMPGQVLVAGEALRKELGFTAE